MSTFIPVVIDAEHPDNYRGVSTPEINVTKLEVDGKQVDYKWGTVDLNDTELVITVDEYQGAFLDIAFKPRQTAHVHMVFKKDFRTTYVRDFSYVYTAKTSKYWNGTIDTGYFSIEIQNMKELLSYDVPNAVKNGDRIESTMKNFDGDALYRVNYDAGGRYHHVGPDPKPKPNPFPFLGTHGFIATFIAVVVATVIAIEWHGKSRRE
jgi:hypothetical protein